MSIEINSSGWELVRFIQDSPDEVVKIYLVMLLNRRLARKIMAYEVSMPLIGRLEVRHKAQILHHIHKEWILVLECNKQLEELLET